MKSLCQEKHETRIRGTGLELRAARKGRGVLPWRVTMAKTRRCGSCPILIHLDAMSTEHKGGLEVDGSRLLVESW